MPTAWILVGIPGSGKTTWIQNNFLHQTKIVVTSTDKFVDEYASANGKTYSAVFEEAMPAALEKMLAEVKSAFKKNYSLVWDQTSTTIASRAKKIRMIPKHYERVAVVFPTPKSQELAKRLASRPGKIIPDAVINDMINGFTPPTPDEGFDRIIWI